MHIKFLRHGTGDPDCAVDYLLASHDHKGAPRPEVRVLRGDPYQVAAVVNNLPFVHRYTSCIIAWAPEDDPTPDEVNAVLDDFEAVAFSGLSPDRYSYTAISHGGHVHAFIAKVDLLSGKRLNVAPPQWKGAFKPLRDYWNWRMGWARPDDPRRSRLLAMPAPHPSPANAKLLHEHLELGFALTDIETALDVEPDPEFLITDWLVDLVYQDKIHAPSDVLQALSAVGTVVGVRAGSLDFILHADPEGHQRVIRLRGLLYSQSFTAQDVLDRQRIQQQVRAGRGDPDLKNAEAAYERMQQVIAWRAADNLLQFQVRAGVNGNKKKGAVGSVGVDLATALPQSRPSAGTNSIGGQARRALDLARQAIGHCLDACKARMQSLSPGVAACMPTDRQQLERAARAKSLLGSATPLPAPPLERSKSSP